MHLFSLFGTKVFPSTNRKTFEIIKNNDFSKSNYICVLGLIEILEGSMEQELQNAFNGSLFNPLHSRIVELIAKRKGFKETKTLDPVWLLTSLLDEDFTHYFYGTDDETLKKLETKIQNNFPRARVLGYKAPPFVSISEIKDNEDIQKDIENINNLKPDIIWISLGGLKQDLLMYYQKDKLDRGLMIGVGAVFDCFVGNIKLRPDWMKRMGISWLYYLIQQPKFRALKLIKLSQLFFRFYFIKQKK